MKIITIISFLLATGCASVRWEKTDSDGAHEKLQIFSLFRSLDGLEAERGEFKLKVNKLRGEATPQDIAEALRQVKPFF